jgi:hypothetical protein
MIDFWKILDFCMFSMMIVIMGELNEDFVGEGKVFEDIGADFFNASLHSI